MPKKPKPTTETAIQPTPVQSLVNLGEGDELFLSRYQANIDRVKEEYPTSDKLDDIMEALPDEFADPIIDIVKKSTGNQKGVYTPEGSPDFPELKIYHGTGNDPNRPKKQIPGEYYLTSGEPIGEAFEGTVLAIWSGRTMWGDAESGTASAMPLCSSMDRKIGSTLGDCEKCPNKPWRDNRQQQCSDDVVAFMLSKKLNEIVLVRFQKTSEPSGRRLVRHVKRSLAPWKKWYQITAESRTSKTDASRKWFVMHVEPMSDDDALVPKELYDFCDAMCSMLEGTYILPNIASDYRQGQKKGETQGGGGGSAGLVTAEDAEEDYGDMKDAPSAEGEPSV